MPAALSILEEEQKLSNAELARRCFLTPQTMHKFVTGMEEKGLVERKSDPTHGRKINTLLTSSGKKILGEAHQIVKTIEQEMTAGLSADDFEATIKNLEHCVISLKEE